VEITRSEKDCDQKHAGDGNTFPNLSYTRGTNHPPILHTFHRNSKMSRYATAEDFTRWEESAATMTVSQLHYASVDCFATASNWRGVDPILEGFYLDQGCTYAGAMRRLK